MEKLYILIGKIDYEGERMLGIYSTKDKAIADIYSSNVTAMCFDRFEIRTVYVDMPSTITVVEHIEHTATTEALLNTPLTQSIQF